MSATPGPWALLRAVFSPESDLGHSERSVLMSLVQHGNTENPGRGARPSIRRLAACTGLHHRTVIRAMRTLVDTGLVTQTHRTNGARAEYTVNLDILLNRGSDVTGDNGAPVLGCHPTVSRMSPEPVTTETCTVPMPLTVQKKTSRSKSKPATNGSGFGAWYATYPRHEARQDAERAWVKLTDAERSECLARSPAWIQAKAGTDRKYLPLPATFLNGRRWRDELETPGASGRSQAVSPEDLEALRLAREDSSEVIR